MSIIVRIKEAAAGLRVGEEAALDAATAKFLHEQGRCWITGGDAADFDATGLVCDEGEIPPAVIYPPAMPTAEVVPAQTTQED